MDAGHRRGDALDDLEERRQIGHGTEHREADDEADDRDQGEGPDPEQLERQHGFDRPPFDLDEPDEEYGSEDGEADDLRRSPRPRGAAERGHEDQAGGDGGDEEGAEVVDGVPGRTHRDVQHGRDHEQGDDPDRQVDVEHPAPGEVLGEETAEQRPEDAGGAEDGAEEALVLAALAGRHEVADDRHGQHHEAAAADALDRAEADELRHVLGDAAEGGADEEEDDGRLEEFLPSVLVAELAPQGVAAVDASM